MLCYGGTKFAAHGIVNELGRDEGFYEAVICS
jgi:hypothetical protein